MSTPLFRKLNLSTQSDLVVLDAPPEFETELEALEGVEVRRSLSGRPASFVLAFATERAAIERLAPKLAKAPGDAIVWIAYPKGTSKKYRCDFNRDSGWEPVGQAGFEAVRQVAIDEDWSALRFRRAEFIKSLARDPKRVMSAAGKTRAAANRNR